MPTEPREKVTSYIGVEPNKDLLKIAKDTGIPRSEQLRRAVDLWRRWCRRKGFLRT